MKRTFASVVLPMVLLSVTAFAQTGSAAPAAAAATPAPNGPAKIGIINIQQAILLTNEGKRDFESLDKKFEPKRTELQTLSKEVDDLKKQLSTQSDKLNDETKGKMARDLEVKQKSLQRSLEDAQQEYQGQQTELVNRIGGKLMEVLDKFAKSNGFTVILDVSSQQSPVLWAGAQTDVTQEIATAYNSQSGIAAPASTTPSAPSATRPSAAVTRPPGSTAPKTTPR